MEEDRRRSDVSTEEMYTFDQTLYNYKKIIHLQYVNRCLEAIHHYRLLHLTILYDVCTMGSCYITVSVYYLQLYFHFIMILKYSLCSFS